MKPLNSGHPGLLNDPMLHEIGFVTYFRVGVTTVFSIFEFDSPEDNDRESDIIIFYVELFSFQKQILEQKVAVLDENKCVFEYE